MTAAACRAAVRVRTGVGVTRLPSVELKANVAGAAVSTFLVEKGWLPGRLDVVWDWERLHGFHP